MRVARLIAVSILAIVPGIATGAPPYLSTDAQWTTFALGAVRCVAVNRPLAENNASPYNALWFSQKVGEAGTELRVFYWPGAFKAGETTTLTVTFDGGPVLAYPATAMDEYSLEADAPLSDDDIATLGRSQLTSVSAKGLSDGTLFFMTDKAPAVAASLTECAATLSLPK